MEEEECSIYWVGVHNTAMVVVVVAVAVAACLASEENHYYALCCHWLYQHWYFHLEELFWMHLRCLYRSNHYSYHQPSCLSGLKEHPLFYSLPNPSFLGDYTISSE